tara:strand:+ start:3538 stop:4341 length:804 start_codon:yes stop_codon:yes gene_type:complete
MQNATNTSSQDNILDAYCSMFIDILCNSKVLTTQLESQLIKHWQAHTDKDINQLLSDDDFLTLSIFINCANFFNHVIDGLISRKICMNIFKTPVRGVMAIDNLIDQSNFKSIARLLTNLNEDELSSVLLSKDDLGRSIFLKLCLIEDKDARSTLLTNIFNRNLVFPRIIASLRIHAQWFGVWIDQRRHMFDAAVSNILDVLNHIEESSPILDSLKNLIVSKKRPMSVSAFFPRDDRVQQYDTFLGQISRMQQNAEGLEMVVPFVHNV